MKKLITLATAVASLGAAHAATITIAAGFNAAAATNVTVGGVAPSSFTVAVGSWDGTTFTQFGAAITDSGTVNGQIVATGPAEVNSDVIFVYVGIGGVSTTAGEGQWALFRTSTNTAFPADVSNPLGSATVNLHNSTPGTVVFVAGNNATYSNNTVNFVPEPSAALLGALGVVGLLRRRRR